MAQLVRDDALGELVWAHQPHEAVRHADDGMRGVRPVAKAFGCEWGAMATAGMGNPHAVAGGR